MVTANNALNTISPPDFFAELSDTVTEIVADPIPFFPQELKQRKNWVLWEMQTRDGKETKVPLRAVPGRVFAKPDSPATWAAYPDACRALRENNLTVSSVAGLGFVHDGAEIISVDLDACRNPESGETAPWAAEFLRKHPTYTEVTPSLTGFRAIYRINAPLALPNGRQSCKWDKPPLPGLKTDKAPQLEVFVSHRYITATGNAIGPQAIAPYDGFISELPPKQPAEAPTVVSSGKFKPEQFADEYAKLPGIVKVPKYDPKQDDSKVEFAIACKVAEYLGPKCEWDFDVIRAGVLLLIGAGKTRKATDKKALNQGYIHRTVNNAIGAARARFLHPDQTEGEEMIATEDHPRIESPKDSGISVIDRLVVVDADQFIAEDIPEREVLMSGPNAPLFYKQSINQIFAVRGTGKTLVALSIAKALATGSEFLKWKSDNPRRVLYVEGELPAKQMQTRVKTVVGPTNGFLKIVTLDKQVKNEIPALNTLEGQAFINRNIADHAPEVLILDSISTLTAFGTNDEDQWLLFLRWLMILRSKGLCVLFLHHAGKSGMQRGHSRSEDQLDVSIKLTHPAGYRFSEGLRAVLDFDKMREQCTDADSLEIQLITQEGKAVWSYALNEETQKRKALSYLHEGFSVREVADLLKVPKSTIGYWKKSQVAATDAEQTGPF